MILYTNSLTTLSIYNNKVRARGRFALSGGKSKNEEKCKDFEKKSRKYLQDSKSRRTFAPAN
ncbi:MAG: hypothetical protein J5545_13475, partial [Bacteroidaceae bacterium]|nr:hypothetical protein [Bacteroidaceae bacterium]